MASSEVRLRLRAPSYAELLAEAGRAVSELELRGRTAVGPSDWHDLEVSAVDRQALLAEWVNELLFRAEVECWVATEFDQVAPTDTRVTARVRGVEVTEAPGLVKAATYHGLIVRETAGGFEGEVVLDV